jgi:hypothetical protein
MFHRYAVMQRMNFSFRDGFTRLLSFHYFLLQLIHHLTTIGTIILKTPINGFHSQNIFLSNLQPKR